MLEQSSSSSCDKSMLTSSDGVALGTLQHWKSIPATRRWSSNELVEIDHINPIVRRDSSAQVKEYSSKKRLSFEYKRKLSRAGGTSLKDSYFYGTGCFKALKPRADF
ncbi:hypothetical protein Dimus_020164 [Dionaea muscipula]